jgi:hypothetical protein
MNDNTGSNGDDRSLSDLGIGEPVKSISLELFDLLRKSESLHRATSKVEISLPLYGAFAD